MFQKNCILPTGNYFVMMAILICIQSNKMVKFDQSSGSCDFRSGKDFDRLVYY